MHVKRARQLHHIIWSECRSHKNGFYLHICVTQLHWVTMWISIKLNDKIVIYQLPCVYVIERKKWFVADRPLHRVNHMYIYIYITIENVIKCFNLLLTTKCFSIFHINYNYSILFRDRACMLYIYNVLDINFFHFLNKNFHFLKF